MEYILVTGARGGMGRAVVRALADRGYGVFALDITEGAAEERVIPLVCDITSEGSVLAAAEKVRETTDRLFAVLHYAGMYMLDSLVEMDTASFERIFRVNVFGAYLVNRIFMPFLHRGSRILITTSELAPLDPLPFTGIYAVTKAALDKYARSLCMELQLLGISVSVLRAGAVDTGMLGASTAALASFCERTKLYTCNAARFRRIVDSVEARCVPPEKVAQKTLTVLTCRRPAFAYTLNRNPWLRLLQILPGGLRQRIIRQVLRERRSAVQTSPSDRA